MPQNATTAPLPVLAQAPVPAPAQAPTAPAAPAAPGVPDVVPNGADPAAVLRGFRAQREELGEQLETLEEQRQEISQEILQARNQGLDVNGLQTRLGEIDKRIVSVDQQIAAADMNLARASAVPGAIAPEPKVVYRDNGDDEAAAFFGGVSFVLVLMVPYVMLRRWRARRRGAAATPVPAESNDRLRSIEQSVEAIAVEMERIGEGQRFMSRFFTERGGISALAEGAAQPVPVGSAAPGAPGAQGRERVPQAPPR